MTSQADAGINDCPQTTASFDAIEQAHGYIDSSDFTPESVVLSGWMLHPHREMSSLRLFVDGADVGPVALEERADVAQVFSWIPHAAKSGFRVCLDPSAPGHKQQGRIDLIGYVGDSPVARLSTLYRTDLYSVVPTPPPQLMHRVARTSDSRFFKMWGLKCYGDMQAFFRRYAAPEPTAKLLDWGCGCGRMTAHFLMASGGPDVYGCDVDGEAVAWCNANLESGHFATIQPFPPTSYPNGSFQFVAGYSIFTHLTREAQFAWLTEIRRILAPGGIFVATVHGDFASSLAFPRNAASILAAGIYDGVHDEILNGIVPDGYYRGTFQTEEYTRREWGKHLDILEYKVRGIGNHQDAVVMRRSA